MKNIGVANVFVSLTFASIVTSCILLNHGNNLQIENYSVSDICDGVEDDSFSIDEFDINEINYILSNNYKNLYYDNLFECNSELSFEELDNIYQEAYKNKDKELCNSTICLMGTAILKGLASKSYNLDINKIEDFSVSAKRLSSHLDDSKDYFVDEYGISFMYDNKKYLIYAENDYAEDICSIVRAGYHNQLMFDYADYDKYVFENAYNELKNTLMMDFCYDNKPFHQSIKDYSKSLFSYEKIDGEYYDGSFKLSKSREKKNKVKNYLNTLEDKNNDKFKKITNLPK